jgi:hypothetical protein
MDGGLARRAGELRMRLAVAFAVALSLALTPALSRGAVQSPAPSTVATFFTRPVIVINRPGQQTLKRFYLLGIGPAEGVTYACSACGQARFIHSGTVLRATHPITMGPTTHVIIGATASGLAGRWKVYGLRRNGFADLDQGCMPAGVTTLTAAEAADPSSIPQVSCSIQYCPSGEEDVLWQGTDRQLYELQYAFRTWGSRTPVGSGPMYSAPTIVLQADGEQDVFWRGRDGQLREMWFTSAWNGPITVPVPVPLASAPAAIVDAHGVDHVFWKGTDGILWEISDPGGAWGPNAPFGSGPLASAPAATLLPDGEQDVFWKGTDGGLYEMRRTTGWSVATRRWGAGELGSGPTVAADTNGVDHVFWKGTNSILYELAGRGVHWPRRSRYFGAGILGSAPGVAIHLDGEEDVFWSGYPGRRLWEYQYIRSNWYPAGQVAGSGVLGSQPVAAVCD